MTSSNRDRFRQTARVMKTDMHGSCRHSEYMMRTLRSLPVASKLGTAIAPGISESGSAGRRGLRADWEKGTHRQRACQKALRKVTGRQEAVSFFYFPCFCSSTSTQQFTLFGLSSLRAARIPQKSNQHAPKINRTSRRPNQSRTKGWSALLLFYIRTR